MFHQQSLREDVSTRIQDGLEWLQDQSVQGLWGPNRSLAPNVPCTCWAACILHSLGRLVKLDEIYEWVVSVQNEDGGWGISHGHASTGFCTAAALQLIDDYARADGNIASAKLREALIWTRNGLQKGGFTFRKEMSPNTYDTITGLHSSFVLTQHFGEARQLLDAAILHLQNRQNPDGSWSLLPDWPPCPHQTSYALEVVQMCSPTFPRIRRAVEWLVTTQTEEGFWPLPDGPVILYESPLQVLLHELSTLDNPCIQKAISAWQRWQQPCGGWTPYPLSKDAEILTTCDALRAGQELRNFVIE